MNSSSPMTAPVELRTQSADVERHTSLRRFKALFEDQKRKLIYSQKVLDQDFYTNQDDLLDEVDLTSTELETSMRLRLRNREALFLRKIDEALGRIAAGTFGACEACEEEIELKRLEARPTATLCVGCKEEEEKMEHLHVDGQKNKSVGKKMRFVAS